MSRSLNSVKGGYVGREKRGTTKGDTKGDTRSLDPKPEALKLKL